MDCENIALQTAGCGNVIWKCSAAAGAIENADLAAVQADDLLHEVEAKAEAAAARLQAMEGLEDAFAVLGGHAFAFVGDGDAGGAVDAYGDGAAPAAMLDGVLHEIGDGALERGAVAYDLDAVGLGFEGRLVAGGDGERRQIGRHLAADLDEVDRRARRS